MIVSTTQPTAFPVITLIGLPLSVVLCALLPFVLVGLPIGFVLWLVFDIFWGIRGLRALSLFRGERLVRVAAPQPEVVDAEYGRVPSRPLSVGRAEFWDPFGGYPRPIAVLASDPKRRHALVQAGMLPAAPLRVDAESSNTRIAVDETGQASSDSDAEVPLLERRHR